MKKIKVSFTPRETFSMKFYHPKKPKKLLNYSKKQSKFYKNINYKKRKLKLKLNISIMSLNSYFIY